ncbi:hypothetical protein HBB16_19830 [Pseudonocardia sp. MCCB 268]|nr:hypothetical protein [Pseudonocardia cytotoxica]
MVTRLRTRSSARCRAAARPADTGDLRYSPIEINVPVTGLFVECRVAIWRGSWRSSSRGHHRRSGIGNRLEGHRVSKLAAAAGNANGRRTKV